MIFRNSLIAAISFPLLIAGCASGGGEGEQVEVAPRTEDPQLLELSDQAAQNAGIEIAVAQEAKIQRTLVLQGEIQPVSENLASIVARLEGVVTKIFKKEGDHVETGEEIVTIESKKLAETKLAYLEAEHKLEFAEDALERERKLMDRQITSKEVFQKVEHDLEEAELGHAAALQRLKLLGFSEKWLHKLEKNPNQKMTSYTLRAPFGGEVVKKDVTIGEAVVEDKTLFNLADLTKLNVEIQVPMRSIPSFEMGKVVSVKCETLSLETSGKTTFISSTAEVETRTIPVRVTIDNPDGKWRPGMPAAVVVEDASHMAEVAVPVEAIQDVDGRPTVFVQTDDNSYRLVNVKLGEGDEHFKEITEGLKKGDRVAAANSLTLKSEYLKKQGG